MKKILFHTILLLCAGWMAVSCEKSDLAAPDHAADEGQLLFSLAMPQSDVTRALNVDKFDAVRIRIYKYNDADQRELVRNYFSQSDMPSEVWLKEGRYQISVVLGNTQPATAAERVGDSLYDCCFTGESDFEIKAGDATPVEVVCDMLNTVIEVAFDETVPAAFDLDYRTLVLVSNDEEPQFTDLTGKLSMEYTTSRSGYFLLPDDAEKFHFCFLGHSSQEGIGDEEGAVHVHGQQAINPAKRAGYRYKLTFKYSEDAGGYLTWRFNVTVNTDWQEHEDIKGVTPGAMPPVIEGEGADGATQVILTSGKSLSYTLSSGSADIKTITIQTADAAAQSRAAGELLAIDCDNPDQYASQGVRLDVSNRRQVVLTLEPLFFETFVGGGEQLLTLTAMDATESTKSVTVQLKTPGIASFVQTDKWLAAAEVTAETIEEASKVEIRYRTASDGQWTTVAAVRGEGNTYTAPVAGVNAGVTIECQLVVDGVPTGSIRSYTADSTGAQLPNAGFEQWSGTSPLCPYLANGPQFWDTGNHGSKTVGANVTTNSSEAHSGTYSAMLKSSYFLIKFAAGNIFVGTYIETYNTSQGCIGFGQPFDYDYRPKAVRFWYKGTVGSINRGSGAPGVSSGDSDVAQFYVVLGDMEGPHLVKTTDKDTFLNLDGIQTIDYCTKERSQITNKDPNDATGNVIGYGFWEKSQKEIVKTDGKGGKTTEQTEATLGWTEVVVPINYNDYGDQKPTYIMVTASSSKYGDYFMGSDSSVMYIDDVELIY